MGIKLRGFRVGTALLGANDASGVLAPATLTNDSVPGVAAGLNPGSGLLMPTIGPIPTAAPQ